MASRIGVQVPRLALFVVVGVFATATMTWGAATQLTTTPAPTAQAPVVPRTVVVPDVTGQAYVFAKGTLEDAGFAWRVGGSVHGYAANTVVGQSPAAGTRLRDTGAPTVTVKLAASSRYAQHGNPEDLSPYRGTAVVLANAPAAAKPKPAAPAAPAAAPAPKRPAAAKPKPAAKPAAKRPPAFTVPGAPKEPLDELPLVDRARLLSKWLDTHTTPSDAAVKHFLYQHAWVVTGARFGWWKGADALRVLVAADRKAERLWGIGGRSELAARTALAQVETSSR
jgi:PASTA domain